MLKTISVQARFRSFGKRPIIRRHRNRKTFITNHFRYFQHRLELKNNDVSAQY